MAQLRVAPGGEHVLPKEPPQTGGFDFGLAARNARLAAAAGAAARMPAPMSTGTTICGVVYAGGVVLGADTRATGGSEVADKNCEKIHYLAPNIYCCGAGTAADTEKTTELIASQLELLRLGTGTQSRVVAATTLLKRTLFKYQGHVSAALVLGGVDCTGPALYQIYPHGSTAKLPYVTMGSGSNVDVTIIRTGGEATVLRGYETPNDTRPLREAYVRPKALVPVKATAVLSTQVEVTDADAMEL